jgi:hypothetical protein
MEVVPFLDNISLLMLARLSPSFFNRGLPSNHSQTLLLLQSFLHFLVTFLSRSAQHQTSTLPAPARKLAPFATLNIEAHMQRHMPGSSSTEMGAQQ